MCLVVFSHLNECAVLFVEENLNSYHVAIDTCNGKKRLDTLDEGFY